MAAPTTITAGKAQIVVVQGEIDLLTAPEFRASLDWALTFSRYLVLDLKDCTFLDASGLRAIVDAWQTVVDCHGWLRVCSAPATIRRVLEISGLEALTYVYPTRDSAMADARR